MNHPFGRGINFEIQVTGLSDMLARLEAAGVAIYFGPEERWRRVGSVMTGAREICLKDTDGYLVRFSQGIGKRPVACETRDRP
jgi:hypothetical protein